MENNKAGVQDDTREISLASLFNLRRGVSRIDVDAYDVDGSPWELKTTSKGGVSTARDLGPKHLAKWRKRHWLIARGRRTSDGFLFERYFYLSPAMMEGWFSTIETKFSTDVLLSSEALRLLGSLEQEKLVRISYLLQRGMLLNDPNIPWKYVETNGVEITSNHAQTLLYLARMNQIAKVENDR